MIARRAERADWAPRAAILWMLRVTAGHALVTLWLRMSVGTKYSADSQARSSCHLATIGTTHVALNTFNSSDGPSKTLPCKSCVVLWYGRLVVDAFSKALPPASVKVMLFASTLGLGLNVE